ncbi:twin-arginine translocation signal domain-containing protein [Halarchaeum nitratireducens]|uniref:Envelope protein N-terminal domain-containing protein n=1 Tax=Halarchaeum nitratireducens TaxID=489913 RepID=A0A830GCN4_9EURY|nr:twin-arginine translocation signal domain-containing protein [Halarchaeum nitratireducens]GGN18621.1 hypothetical protein GCM10009021_19530 [Halarchaeum nitratireducens]
MSENKQPDVGSRQMTRRGLIKTVGVGVGAATIGGVGLQQTDDAAAIDVGTALAAAGSATGLAGAQVAWMLRDWNPFAGDSPPDGLSADALKQRVRQTVKTRKSTNASTIIDNQNIISAGLENTLYIEGKTAAVEQLNNGKTQDEVQSAAINAMEAHMTTVEKNLLKTWNESVNELNTLASALKSHPDASPKDVLAAWYKGGQDDRAPAIAQVSASLTLSDGTDFDISRIEAGFEESTWDPVNKESQSGADNYKIALREEDFVYLEYGLWNGIWSDLQTVKTDVNDGLVTWVDSVYGQVQSGDLELGDLTTPRMRANQMADEKGGEANAIADLQALNIPITAGEQTTIEIEKTNATLTLSGTLAYTGDKTIQSGTTYDPSSWSDAVAYFTYDQSTASGTWSAYQTAVDGGIVAFTAAPTEGTAYRISTAANESVTVQGGDFTPVDSSGSEVDPVSTTPDHWEVDLSEKLANPITEVESVQLASGVTESKTKTIILDDPFTVKSIKRDGKSAESATFEQTEPQTDDNYITQDEWEEMQKKNQELIEKYEDSQNSGGFSIPGLGGLGDTGSLIGGFAVLLGGIAGLSYFKGRTT